MKKILIIASTLGRDGTSRFITHFANGMSNSNEFQVSLLFFRPVDPIFLERINSGVEINSLNIEGKLWKNILSIILSILKQKPHFCILGFHQLLYMSFITPLLHVFGIRLLVRDTIIPSLFHKNASCVQRKLLKWAYSCVDNIIVQSKDMQEDLVENWDVCVDKTILVNNPVDTVKLNSKEYECPEELKNRTVFTFVAAGRLTYQKGYDIIIDRMHEMQPKVPFRLLILGSGELEDELKRKIQDYNLEDNIQLIGYRFNVAPYLFHSDALLLCSRYEGFPNIVLEAQTMGKPVFSNSCLGGINEIVINGKNGWACNFEDTNSFETGLENFFHSSYSADEIQDMTYSRYDISIIMNRYISIFKGL